MRALHSFPGQRFHFNVRARTTFQYDACWLLVETIIEKGSTDAGVIADNLITISDSIYGLTGCLALDENGDRLPQLYDISGFYKDPVTYEYLEGTFGSCARAV